VPAEDLIALVAALLPQSKAATSVLPMSP
jgi:hypothetical protein